MSYLAFPLKLRVHIMCQGRNSCPKRNEALTPWDLRQDSDCHIHLSGIALVKAGRELNWGTASHGLGDPSLPSGRYGRKSSGPLPSTVLNTLRLPEKRVEPGVRQDHCSVSTKLAHLGL